MPKQTRGHKHRPATRHTHAAPTKPELVRHTLPARNLQHLLTHPERATPSDITDLQRTVGNCATTRLIQAKLRVGPAGDRDERQADRMAAEIARAPVPRPPTIRQKREDTEHQTKPASEDAFDLSQTVEQQLAHQKGGGSPLTDRTRAFMEPRFGADFGGVRVHTHDRAAQISREINAKAFTHGQDIYFGAGAYEPGTDAGKRLLAHELTHVVQQKGGSVIKPYRLHRQVGPVQDKPAQDRVASIHRTTLPRVQRLFGRGKTTRKSRVYKGRPGGRESQQKVVAVINMTPAQRAEALKKRLVDKPVKGNLNGFNIILPLLEGGSQGTVDRHFRLLGGQNSIDGYLSEIFTGYRKNYLTQVFQNGAPSAKSKFALRAGLLTGTSFTFGRGSGRREHGVNKDLVAFARTLPSGTLREILNDELLTKPLTKKTLRLLQVELGTKEKEAQIADTEEDSEKFVKQIELFGAYQKQLIEMVSHRPVKFFGSRTKHKQQLTNDLQQWAQDKPREIIKKLLDSQSEFSKTLDSKYDKEDVAYIKQLMKNPTAWKEEQGERGQTLESGEASLLQQIEALLTRQTSKNKVSRLRQRGKIQGQIEQLLFGEGGPENAKATVKKLYGENWHKTLGDKLQVAGLAESKTEELLTKIEHGAKSAGDIYQQLWRRVPRETHAKWHRAKWRYRWSRTTLDLIQQLKPGTPEYERVQQDHELLSRIETHSENKYWEQIASILGMGEVTTQERRPRPNTQKWEALLNAELTSKIVNRATLYRHVFNAQQEAWTYGKSQQRQVNGGSLGGLYESRNNAPIGVITGYNAFMKQLGRRIQIAKWSNSFESKSRDRLKQVLGLVDNAAPYPYRLGVGDLLNAAKKTGGKRRTKKEMIEFAFEGLSGQELLDQWTNFDAQQLIFTIKPELWGTREDNANQKGLADLLKRVERVELERALFRRIAAEALQAERSKEEAADAMIATGQMEEEQRDPDAAIQYVAQRTLAIAGLEGAQQLSKGMQWSRFSTRSLIYKEAQSEYLGKLRSTHTDLETSEEKHEKLTQGTKSIEDAEKTLTSEEEAFRALRTKYNQRLKAIVIGITSTIIATLGLVFTGGLSAGPLMAGLIGALAAVLSKGISTLLEYTTEGHVTITDTFRELFVNTVIGFISGIMGNVDLAVRSLGAEALYGSSAKVGAKLFGKPGLSILGGWAQQMSTTVVGAPVHAVDRLLKSSSVTSAWQQSREDFTEKFKNLPLDTLKSYAKGFLTVAVAEGATASGLKDLLPKTDNPALDKLGSGTSGLDAEQTFKSHGAIRPFEFDSWESFWESIVQGSQVNTTDYGKSFIVYEEGVPKGIEVSVLTTDTGPQSMINAYKSMGFKVVMGSLHKGVGKTLSTLAPNEEPTLTDRKEGGTNRGGYEALGTLSTGKMQKLNTLSPDDRAKLASLPVGHLQTLDAEKLIRLAEALDGQQLGKLAALSEGKAGFLFADDLIDLAKNAQLTGEGVTKLNTLPLQHLRFVPPAQLATLATRFERPQLAAFKERNLSYFRIGSLARLPTAILDRYAQLDANLLAHLIDSFANQALDMLADLETGQLEALSRLDPDSCTAIGQLGPQGHQTLSRLHPNQIKALTPNVIASLDRQD